ncbi:MAG: glycogen/starch/alpha-glucan family phosphorylase [Chitinivibrionales bacterium]|nr:glycogen/starch/alpha-glucan family phosphorylase [Chitinivibrionales bacterium]
MIPQNYDWKVKYKGNLKDDLKKSFFSNLTYNLGKDANVCSLHDQFLSLSYAVRERLFEQWILTQRYYHTINTKRIAYLSLEYLPGRFLESNTQNMEIFETTKQMLHDLGINFEQIINEEHDAGLGNGGLGRLASCFMDSMATLKLPAIGYGIRYQYGIFKQQIKNFRQHEVPEEWLQLINPWETERPEYRVRIKFYGKTDHVPKSSLREPAQWNDTADVIAIPYDIPVSGFQNNTVNTLRLWSAYSSNELDLQEFNKGDYIKACNEKIESESISKVLYPSENTLAGKELRLKQEYFFTSASLQDIIRRFRQDNGDDFSLFPEKVAIHLNETHPALAIPELMRLLVDEYHVEWGDAWNMITKVFAYTNHTLMPEALERWPVNMITEMLPRHMEIIYEINDEFLKNVIERYPDDTGRMRRMSIIDEGFERHIRMAHLAIVGSHSINGVAALHSQLMLQGIFKDFYEFWPDKFNNKTNGITPRRWIYKCNPLLTDLISYTIGSDWKNDFSQIKKIHEYADDPSYQEKWRNVKQKNKERLADVLYRWEGITLDPHMIFDVHIKRIHEYKRQLLNILHCIALYEGLRSGQIASIVPRTVIFAGKAAPGYYMAKLIVELINRVAYKINRDRRTRKYLQVHFISNYRVTLAEQIIPAAEISEQISMAGTEASGTGNMKFALNGALTIGTMDGANIEIREEVGKDNMFIFGLKADEVQMLKGRGYNPQLYYDTCEPLKQAFDLIDKGFFSPEDPHHFDPLCHSIIEGGDPFLVMADFESYMNCHKRMTETYLDKAQWDKISIINSANMGKFSSDRTIRQYAKEIWGVESIAVPEEEEGKDDAKTR